MNKFTILITAPHSLCEQNKNEYHECDTIVREVCGIMNKSLHDRKINAEFFFADKPRDSEGPHMDYNKAWSRNEPYRKTITEEMNKIKKSRDYLIDIHSYKKSNELFGGHEVVILDIKKYNQFSQIGRELLNYLSDRYVDVEIFDSREIDILEEAREKRIRSILLEFNESIDKKRLTQICDLIASYFSSRK